MSRKSNFKLYRVWDGIVQRCNNPNAKNYQNYGGRGIKMSDAWRKDFSEREYAEQKDKSLDNFYGRDALRGGLV